MTRTCTLIGWIVCFSWLHAYAMVVPWLPHSLENVVRILVIQFENDPLFCSKTLDFSAQNDPFFMIKQWFSVQNDPLFCGKTLTFQSQMNPLFHGKTRTSNLTPFSLHSQRWAPKYPLFLGEYESWISSKNTPLFANYRTRMSVVK